MRRRERRRRRKRRRRGRAWWSYSVFIFQSAFYHYSAVALPLSRWRDVVRIII
jgi:hypothetical protein